MLRLPGPAVALNARVRQDRVWVTTPTLAQLKPHDITPTIREACVWDQSNRYLDLAAKILADGRKHLIYAASRATDRYSQ